jgi:thymidylate kinase
MLGIVGPCAAGKTTLVANLVRNGYQAKTIAQEHSYVQQMWSILTQPDILIYLDVSYEMTVKRRSLNWDYREFLEQNRRLQHAREHAHLIIDTDPLTSDQVYQRVIAFVNSLTTSAD